MIATLLNQGWVLATILVVFAVPFLLALAKLSKSSKLSSVNSVKTSKLKTRNKLLAKEEQLMFRQLSDALDHEFYIFAKVSVLEFLVTKDNEKAVRSDDQLELFAPLALDFVVCKKSDFSISVVIEADRYDRSNSRGKPTRESLLNKFCDAMSVKVLHLDYGQTFENTDLRRLVTGRATSLAKLESASTRAQRGSANHSIQSTQSVMTEYLSQTSCPKCNSEIVTRMAMKGEHIGERFLMCKKYPYCDYRVPLNQAASTSQGGNSRGVKSDKTVSSSKQGHKGYADWAG